MYKNISDGMNKMFIAQIGAIICTIIAIIPVIGIIGGIGAIVFAIISMIGLYKCGQEVAECKTAFILTIANIVLSLLGNVKFIGVIANLASTVVSFLIIYLVCTSIGKILKDAGSADVADLGDKVWKINFICAIAGVIIGILALIPIIKILAGILGIVVAIAEIVAGVMYIIFLYKGSKALA